jgi:hypothetical protein
MTPRLITLLLLAALCTVVILGSMVDVWDVLWGYIE